MKAHQIVDEHKKGVRAKKYNKKPKAYITPKKPVAGPVQGGSYGAAAGYSGVSEDTDNKPQLMTAFTKFLPLAMHALALKKLPKIKLEKIIIDHEQPTFGKYDDGEQIIYLAIENRHALDILRTLAHELVHFKQNTEHRLDIDSGGTGSEIENEANAQAAIIMRHFNKKYPEFFKDSAVDLEGVAGDQSLEERKKKRRVRQAAYGPGPFGGYGYYAGYSGDSGASDGGGDGGGESIKNEDAMMGKLEDGGKIIRILKKAHTVPFSDEKNWLLIDTDPGKGNSGLGIKWIPADTKFTWVRPYRDTVDENFADGRNPQDKGDSKRHGVPTKASISTLRKVAKQGGRKGQLAHWMANMKSGREK